VIEQNEYYNQKRVKSKPKVQESVSLSYLAGSPEERCLRLKIL
jgi:hypothetical protein